jgi:CBS domain-containing protein
MKVSELMTPEVFTCTDRCMLAEAVKLMWEHDIGFVPVISSETGALVGVVTDRDACICAFFQGKPLWEIPVATAVSSRTATCRPDAEVDEAEEIMSEFQVHRLPVVDAAGKLVGVISINDLARRAAGDADQEFEEEVALTLGAICHRRDNSADAR